MLFWGEVHMESYLSFNTFQGNLPPNQVTIFYETSMLLCCKYEVLDGFVKLQT